MPLGSVPALSWCGEVSRRFTNHHATCYLGGQQPVWQPAEATHVGPHESHAKFVHPPEAEEGLVYVIHTRGAEGGVCVRGGFRGFC